MNRGKEFNIKKMIFWFINPKYFDDGRRTKVYKETWSAERDKKEPKVMEIYWANYICSIKFEKRTWISKICPKYLHENELSFFKNLNI